MAKKVLANLLPPDTLLNINVPSTHQRCPVRVTSQGRRLWENSIHETVDPRGTTHYWIGGGTPVTDPGEDTDVQAMAAGLVSITPIHLDLTNHAGIAFLKQSWQLEEGEKGTLS
jgi:5'-nucleotidase